jgi:hypothetical protein
LVYVGGRGVHQTCVGAAGGKDGEAMRGQLPARIPSPC